MIHFNQVWRLTNSIPGSFTELSARKLYEAALKATDYIVEVGVDQGRSASILLTAAKQTGAWVVLVDSWPSVLIENKAKVEGLIRDHFSDVKSSIIYADSEEASRQLIQAEPFVDLIHIDANHYDDNPAKDCENWLPKLKSGGVVAFHDFDATFIAVTEAVNKYTAGWKSLGNWDGLAMRRKP